MRIPIFSIVVIFVIFLTVNLRVSDKKERKSKQAFLDREANANHTRKQSLDSLDYITIPTRKLPFNENADGEIEKIQNCIMELSTKKIVNFTGISNTELKEIYGVSNLETLTEYDYNFTELSRALNQWGQALYDQNDISGTCSVLEFAIECGSDVSSSFILLAGIYKDRNETVRIRKLLETAKQLNSFSKGHIIRSLTAMLEPSANN